MGKYTALDNPRVDEMIAGHLNQIVEAVAERVSFQAIIFYGSVARGEASVMVDDDQIIMLSDYELSVVGRSPRLRGVLAELSRQMTERLGVDTGINWMRPSRLRTNHTKNLAFGQAAPSIFMYELKSAGYVLSGEDVLRSCPPIDPADIPLTSGIAMVLNRMAEALAYLPCSHKRHPHLDALMWINKIVLACADALLLSARRYHYSYQERGRRFAAADEFLAPLIPQAPAMPRLVERAVEFKLRPRLDLYPDELDAVWADVAAMADVVYRHLMKQQYEEDWGTYAEFPAQHLALLAGRKRRRSLPKRAISMARQKLVESVKYLDQKRRWPPVFRTLHSPSEVVYTLVPVLFQSCFSQNQKPMLHETRRWLTLLGTLDPTSTDVLTEWNHLRQHLIWNWKEFCY